MPQFPSDEWTEELIERFLDHPKASHAAAALAGRYRLVVEPDHGFDSRHATSLEIGVDDDGGAQVDMLEAGADGAGPPPEPVDLSVTASYRRWKALLRGEQGFTRAVATGRVRIGGSKREALRRTGQMGPLLATMGQVETEWPDEAG